jgi:hypothetical protein
MKQATFTPSALARPLGWLPTCPPVGQATSTLVTLTPPVEEVTFLTDNSIGHWLSQSEVGVCTV